MNKKLEIPKHIKDIISSRADPVISEYFRVKYEEFGIEEGEPLPEELRLHPSRIALVGLAEIGYERMGL